MGEKRKRPDDEVDLALRLSEAFVEAPEEEDFDAATELRRVGLDPRAVAARMVRGAARERRKLAVAQMRERIGEWVEALLDEVGERLLPLAPATVLRGAESGDADADADAQRVADPELEEAVALLSNRAYGAARASLDRLLAARGEDDWQLRWVRVHALIGEGELERALAELEAIAARLDAPQVTEIHELLRHLVMAE